MSGLRIHGKWLQSLEAKAVFDALDADGAQVLYVGGCVRNSLLNEEVGDIDIATDRLPEEVVRLAEAAGLETVPSGLQYGTVTVLSLGRAFEVTTFRRDVETDGRWAKVVFSKDIVEDARRRDFTMNAVYATRNGCIKDPLGDGVNDIRARHVRFVGDPADRIREDRLRSLRFFRFLALYGKLDVQIDTITLTAISENIDGIEMLSRERIGAEVMKLLAAPDPSDALGVMKEVGIMARIMPEADDRYMKPLIKVESQSDSIVRLAALGDGIGKTLRIRRSELERAERLREMARGNRSAAELGYRFGSVEAVQALELRAAFQDCGERAIDRTAAIFGSRQVFPIGAADLMPALTGRRLGQRLKVLERKGILSGFTLGRSELLSGR